MGLLVLAIELLSARCDVACHYLGFDSGRYLQSQSVCECIKYKSVEITHPDIVLMPSKKKSHQFNPRNHLDLYD
jgi:hypothetical protein